jgi:phosphoglycerate dehydrogenase-like enzyme
MGHFCLTVLLVFCSCLVILAQTLDSRPQVVVTGLSEEQLGEVREAVTEIEIIPARREEVIEKVGQADALVGTCDPEAIRVGKKLRWVHVNSAGVERCMYPELVNSDILLTNAKIIQGPEIADHALALLLTLTRDMNIAVVNREKERWGREDYDPIELRGKTALVIGIGGIGTQVSERAFAFGMRVLAVDPKDIPFRRAVEKVGRPDQLHEFLPEADVVFMCAPHTPKSEGMMGKTEFTLMKRGAYYINVSRGKTTRTDALVEALRSGHLAGAGLDVFDPEPLPKGHPLWQFENVVITPHIATLSDFSWVRRVELIKENLKRFSKGLPLRHVVMKDKGY